MGEVGTGEPDTEFDSFFRKTIARHLCTVAVAGALLQLGWRETWSLARPQHRSSALTFCVSLGILQLVLN